MDIKKHTILLFVMFMVFSRSLSGDVEIPSAPQCIDEMIRAAETHWETPLRATYKKESTFFYPVSYIKEYMPDGRVKIVLKETIFKRIDPVSGEITEEFGELICSLDEEYGLPYKTERAEVDHYLWKGKYYIEEHIIDEDVQSTYIYDGKDTRKITSPFKDKPEEKWIATYNDTEFYSTGKMILFIPYPYYEITPQFSTSPILSREGDYYNLKIVRQEEDISIHVSPEEGFMQQKVIAYNDGNRTIELKVKKTIRLNDLYLPVEMERKRYNVDGTPKMFTHFEDIKWKLNTVEDMESKLATPNPENAKIVYTVIKNMGK